MTGQNGVVGFDVELEVIKEVVLAEEIQAGGAVGIILVLGWLLWLGFNVKLTIETNFLFKINGHVKKARQVIELPLHVGVDDGTISFATTPKSIALTPQAVGDLDGFLDLGG